MAKSKGRVTIPTDMDVVKETLEIMNGVQTQYVTATEPNFRKNFVTQEQRFMQPITQQERTTLGQRQILMKFSRCIL